MKRRHQTDMEASINEIISGKPTKHIMAVVTPGGGKSALPIIAGKLIKHGLADALCWVVPRSSLQVQGESNFLDPFFRRLFDHRLIIRSSTNDPDPCRGTNGFVTTYQALVADNRNTLQDFRRKRYILVLDEFHHAADGGRWHDAINKLVERARYTVLMTGTLERGDGTRIAFVPYIQADGREYALTESSRQLGIEVIRYDRFAALSEQAILPVQFSLCDCSVAWVDEIGQEIDYDSIARVTKKDNSKALFSALTTEFADQLLDKTVNDWIQHTCSINPRSKLLVVTAGIENAKAALQRVRKVHGLTADIATSHETAAAHRAIKQFKTPKLDVLVTIAMAYEGLDVPAVTHIACLTHIRSKPWIEQMIARAVRVDHLAGPYESQCAYVFAPADKIFKEIVKKIEDEQAPLARSKLLRAKQASLFGEEMGDGNNPQITPIGSQMTDTYRMTLGEVPSIGVAMTPSEEESSVRKSIEQHVRAFCFAQRYENSRLNYEIKHRFGKPRSNMTLPELKKVLDWVRKAYPLNGRSTVKTGVSQVRTTIPRSKRWVHTETYWPGARR